MRTRQRHGGGPERCGAVVAGGPGRQTVGRRTMHAMLAATVIAAVVACVPDPGIERLRGVTELSAGALHTCALMDDSTVNCWGDNLAGQLGDGTNTNRYLPTPVAGLSGVAKIDAAAWSHTCAVMVDGTAQCWGFNSKGQLGDGTTTSRSVPTPVVGVSDVVEIAGGSYHSCAVSSDGTARCWGDNNRGQLGDGTTTDRSSPVVVTGLTDVVDVSAHGDTSCALTSTGDVWCWGFNDSGQLGDGTTTDSSIPRLVTNLGDAVELSTGPRHSCVRRSDDSASCWGNNNASQLGDGTLVSRPTPGPVIGVSDVVDIDSGGSVIGAPWRGTACALLADTSVTCWGSSFHVDPATPTAQLLPAPIPNLDQVAAVSNGGRHSCALMADTTVRCWGHNSSGQLGIGTSEYSRSTPSPVMVTWIGP